MNSRNQQTETILYHIETLEKLAENAPAETKPVLLEAKRYLKAALEALEETQGPVLGDPHQGEVKNDDLTKQVEILSKAFADAGLDYQSVMRTVTRGIGKAFGDPCILLMFNRTGEQLETTSAYFSDHNLPDKAQEMLGEIQTQTDQKLVLQILEAQGPVLIQSPSSNKALKNLIPKGYKTFFQEYPIQSALLTPLRAQERPIGILGVFRFEADNPHTDRERQLLENIAGRAGPAIEYARLFTAESQRARALNGLHTATAALLSTLDLDELLGRILDAAQSAIPAAEKGMLHLVAPDSGKLQTSALLGYADAPVKIGSHDIISDYIVQAVRERKPLLIRDTEILAPAIRDDPLAEGPPIRSTIIAPLILGESVLGVLSLNASQPRAFTESDLRVLESFAATTSAAIQNARLHAKVQKLAITDPLTGLYNRRGFFELGNREIERFRRFGHPLSAVMLDIDHLKVINDTYGHATGDQVLKALAERLDHNIRGVDILGRYGGDEFCILLPETDLATANVIAGRLRKSIARHPISTDDGLLSITISVGIARATEETTDLDMLLSMADGAMYTAKQGGRDRVEIG